MSSLFHSVSITKQCILEVVSVDNGSIYDSNCKLKCMKNIGWEGSSIKMFGEFFSI